ncbi:ATP-dependent DNA helicase recG [Candidatus Photodesmus katoptron]|uniref:ATP-dependent DNA helicase RecG n=1 Tax=Candidatus Photodesmus anomalopis TaxID=28176 RepID=UPI0004DA7D69|nr:ATP-dependent DNA helicase RecG [Candidatus Photodesmus katoptron]KEY90149.1 ATP-dependent DNA helicase recG [Candidatus Photodesmus katoptron]
MPVFLSDIHLSSLPQITNKLIEELTQQGIKNVQDLLFHLPLRYEDRTRIYPIAKLYIGLSAAVQGKIIHLDTFFYKQKIFTVTVSDGKNEIVLRFLNVSDKFKNFFLKGKLVYAYGKVKQGYTGLEMVHPDYKLFTPQRTPNIQHNLTPIYPRLGNLKQTTLRNLTSKALKILKTTSVKELLPAGLYDGQITITQAIHIIHRPSKYTNMSILHKNKHPAKIRLILEELLAQNLFILKIRHKNKKATAISLTRSVFLKKNLLKQLPFSLTNAQIKVAKEIEDDLTKTQPMMRLLQGDVGSGKTLIAALAAIQAIENGYQVAFMAPTELLAEQHIITFCNWFDRINIKLSFLLGKLKGKSKITELTRIANGEAKMIIGTQALFQKHVKFYNLALVIIDEQHRFGVHQRLEMRKKGLKYEIYPHKLIMTATPIPRTLTMTIYADLAISIIDELPPNRTPVQTVAIPSSKRSDIMKHIYKACLNEEKQAYWICTLINDSKVLKAESAIDIANKLRKNLPNIKIGLLHGRMNSNEKQKIMNEFKDNKLHLLVSTTVIEVGVDIPNASLMIIENAERLGLAQLHQLRGRIGRGKIASYCVLLYHTPLSKIAKNRLSVLRNSNDGFFIAQKDLEMRGPGQILGTKQTGLIDFKIADLMRDQYLIPKIKKISNYIYKNHPKNTTEIINRWISKNNVNYDKA